MTTLVASGVRKSYGDHVVLHGIDLTIGPGEICGLLGPNGAGKTTFASIVAGIRRSDAGRVTVAGVDVAERPAAVRRSLGYAPQNLGIYPLATVKENLRLFGELAGLGRRELAERLDRVASALGLTELMGRVAGMLSGGEQRRLHTGMALLHRPALVLLDEPTVAADVHTRATLLEFVRDLARDGTAVCYSTHYLQEVEVLDATVALIDEGRILTTGSVSDLVDTHGTTFVEFRFEGTPPPRIRELPGATSSDGTVRVPTRDPARDTARLVAGLGDDAARLVGLEIVRPSLESVFIGLTGRRLSEDTSGVDHAAG